MRIVIASGKGGTGKTTVATNLAYVASRKQNDIQLLDCDVEEPNCHIFVKPVFEQEESVETAVPDIIEQKCTGCGICLSICKFNSLALIGRNVLTFPELCHGCGGCWLVCPERAIIKGSRIIGSLKRGTAEGFSFAQGELRIGDTMSPLLIHQVKAACSDSGTVIIDAPPGTSCPVVETIKDSDFVCLVTEPTPFGLNDLELAVELVKTLKIPMGVIINRSDAGDDRVNNYCFENKIPVLAEIPHKRSLAEAYSCGHIASQKDPDMEKRFNNLWKTIKKRSKQ